MCMYLLSETFSVSLFVSACVGRPGMQTFQPYMDLSAHLTSVSARTCLSRSKGGQASIGPVNSHTCWLPGTACVVHYGMSKFVPPIGHFSFCHHWPFCSCISNNACLPFFWPCLDFPLHSMNNVLMCHLSLVSALHSLVSYWKASNIKVYIPSSRFSSQPPSGTLFLS